MRPPTSSRILGRCHAHGYAKQDFSKRFNPKYWLFLSVIFFQLSLDEWFSIHDPLGKFIGRLFFPSLDKLFGWTFVYLFFCIILV